MGHTPTTTPRCFVYENTCASPLYACNDDVCSSPLYADYVSRIPGIWFYVGHTYYIIVDGYNGAAGNYYLTMDPFVFEPDLPCPDGSLHSQPPHNADMAWTGAASDTRDPGEATDNSVIRFDTYTVQGWIHDIHWWGLSAAYPWAACDEDPMTFEIKFYPDVAGSPTWPIRRARIP